LAVGDRNRRHFTSVMRNIAEQLQQRKIPSTYFCASWSSARWASMRQAKPDLLGLRTFLGGLA
jgi:hypothetical protein